MKPDSNAQATAKTSKTSFPPSNAAPFKNRQGPVGGERRGGGGGGDDGGGTYRFENLC
jgi:hypothetical protein